MIGNPLYFLLTMMYIAEGITAITNTKRKEKYMIEDGEPPLPKSSYVFLFIQYILRILLSIVLIFVVPEEFQFNMTGLLIFAVMLAVVPIVARLIEVLIRVAIVRYMQKKYIEQLKDKEGKKETI
nr:MAG TPA: hypothetical protein [Herelleviridae sp.]